MKRIGVAFARGGTARFALAARTCALAGRTCVIGG